MDLNAVEILQLITLAWVGFVWTEIKTIRNDLANARERLQGLETLEKRRDSAGS